MNKTLLLMCILIGFGVYNNCQAESNMKSLKSGEQIFLENADECIAIIEKAAQKEAISGVAIIAFIPGNKTESWISKMKVVGAISRGNYNFLGIAYAKASEMAITLKDSGDGERKDIVGEYGFQGGVILKVSSGYLVAAFSGASSQQDADVSKLALEWLSEKYSN